MPEDQSQKIKMFGYLEKRGKMTIRGRWKRRWCVLEGHLLLYYKSQTEYLKLSPCCGSLNVALVRKIQPNVGCLIHITTHSQLIILRTPNKEKQEEWFFALASILTQNNHDGLQYNESLFPTVSSHRKSEKRKNRRSVKISETDKQNHFCNIKFIAEENNIYSTKTKIISKGTEQTRKTQVLKNIPDRPAIHRCSSDSDIQSSLMKSNIRESRNFSCDCIFTSLISSDRIISTQTIHDDFGDKKRKRKSQVKWNRGENEFLFVGNYENSPKRGLKKRNQTKVVHRHSFGFLKKILTRRKSRQIQKGMQNEQLEPLQDSKNCCFTSVVAVTTELDIKNVPEELPHSDESTRENSNINSFAEETTVNITQTNESMQIDENKRWTEMNCDRTSPDEVLPELPVKTKKNCQRYSWQIEEKINVKSEIEDSHIISNPNAELDELMSQLKDLNKEPDFLHTTTPTLDDTIPDYDIPRSHLSIISEIISEKTDQENSSIDSPDCGYDHLSTFDMDPDSLEMPWLSDEGLNNNIYWPATNEDHFFFRNNTESDNDESFLDSLNTIMHLS